MTAAYLDLEEILRLHFQIIQDYGGVHGVRDESRLQSVVEASEQTVFDREQYPSIYEKAAVYLRNIIGDHPFIEGNKRTAVTVCAIFLMRNGIRLTAEPQSLEEQVVRVAVEPIDIAHIATWLEANSHRL